MVFSFLVASELSATVFPFSLNLWFSYHFGILGIHGEKKKKIKIKMGRTASISTCWLIGSFRCNVRSLSLVCSFRDLAPRWVFIGLLGNSFVKKRFYFLMPRNDLLVNRAGLSRFYNRDCSPCCGGTDTSADACSTLWWKRKAPEQNFLDDQWAAGHFPESVWFLIVCVDGCTFSLVSAKDVTSLSVSSLLISRGGCVIIWENGTLN